MIDAEITPEMLPLTNEVRRADGQHHAWSACVFFANHKAGDRPFVSVSLDSRDAALYARDVARARLIVDGVNALRPDLSADKLRSMMVDVLRPFAAVAEEFAGVHVVEICQPHHDNPSPHIKPLPREFFERAADLLEVLTADAA